MDKWHLCRKVSKKLQKSEKQAVISAQELAAGPHNEIIAGNDSLWFLEKGRKKTYERGGGAKHEEYSRRKLFAILICSSTTTRHRLFATLYADRKSRFTISDIATHRRQSMGAYSIDFYCLIGHAISCRWTYFGKERSKINSNLCLGRKRRNSVLGTSLSAEKWYQDVQSGVGRNIVSHW